MSNPKKAGVLRDAVYKLRRIRRVTKAQFALDTDIGQLAVVRFMGRPMDDVTRGKMEKFCEDRLAEEGHLGITVEATYHVGSKTVEFTAHAEDRR